MELALETNPVLGGNDSAIQVMLRAITTQLGASVARVAVAKEVVRPSFQYASPSTTTGGAKTLAEKYELLYQSPALRDILKANESSSLVNNILYAEKRNKTTRKVAKKHRKKKGKTVNLRRN